MVLLIFTLKQSYLKVRNDGIIGRKATLEKRIEYQKYCVCGRKILELSDSCIILVPRFIGNQF